MGEEKSLFFPTHTNPFAYCAHNVRVCLSVSLSLDIYIKKKTPVLFRAIIYCERHELIPRVFPKREKTPSPSLPPFLSRHNELCTLCVYATKTRQIRLLFFTFH